jgi:molecular chaperone GrpE
MRSAQDDEGLDRTAAGPVAGEGGPAGDPRSSSTPPSPTPPAEDAEEAGAEVQADLDALAAVEQQRDEYLELGQRTKADFENYRKRIAADVQAASLRGKAELAAQLIGVIDNLERALAAAGIEPGDERAPAEPLAEGFFLTYRELLAALERSGIEPFDPAGERFDPSWHEALQKLPVDGAEAGTVVEVAQKGYRLGEQLVRPARVVVAE